VKVAVWARRGDGCLGIHVRLLLRGLRDPVRVLARKRLRPLRPWLSAQELGLLTRLAQR